MIDLPVGPVVRGALTVLPLFHGAAVAEPGSVLHGVDVAERAGVPVVATHPGDVAALVLEGELLTGGAQHRVGTRSVVVEPGGAAVVAVRCVERHRRDAGRAQVRDGRRGPAGVRAAAGRQAVWDRVAAYGAGGSLVETARSRATAAPNPVRGLRPLALPAGRAVLVEAFGCPRTLARVGDDLLTAAATDAVGREPVATPGHRARWSAGRVRAGTGVRALARRGRTVHATAVAA